MKEPFPAILGRRRTRVSPWVELIEKSVQFNEQADPALYHFVTQADYVHMLAQTPDGSIPLVRQYRPCVEDFTWEFPAGTLEREEAPRDAAVRELLEETGLQVTELVDLGTYFPDTGRVQVLSHAFYARCGAPPSEFDSEEGVAVRYVSHQELKEMMLRGQFRHQLHLGLYAAAVVHGIDLG